MNTVKTGVPSPAPNHSRARINHAIGGVPTSTVTMGRDIIDAVMDRPATRPSRLPAPTDKAKPSIARRAVMASSGPATPLSNKPRKVEKDAIGDGRISSPTCCATKSHAAKNRHRLASEPHPLHR